MKKIISIISAILIAVASIGFLIIPQIFEFRINKLKDENEAIILKQRDASDSVEKSIAAMQNYSLCRDNLDLFKCVSNDIKKINEKENKLLFNTKSSAQYALSAALTVNKIDPKEYDSKTIEVGNSIDINIHKELYKKYIELTGNGTQEIDGTRKINLDRINDLTFWKNALWYFCFFIQSIGFVLAIIALGTETE